MGKNILMPESFVIDTYKLVQSILNDSMSESTIEICKRLEGQINAKIDAIQKREFYTQSKIAPTEEEKEVARKKYLDSIGIQESFRH